MTNIWPPTSSHSGPHVLRLRLPNVNSLEDRWTASFAVELIAELYQRHAWEIVKKRFRMRGSEIDLAVMQRTTRSARIIEVKLRKNQPHLDLEFARSLLPNKKIAALKRGALAIADQCKKNGLTLDWSVDVVLVTPDTRGDTCLVHTWPNAVEFG